MKDVISRLMGRLRARPAPARAAPARAAPAVVRQPPRNVSSAPPTVSPFGVTGQTVFDDRPLRFRSLTVSAESPADYTGPEGPPGAFKIRLAKFSGYRRMAGTLVERRYLSRGYQTSDAAPDPNLFTFLAYDEGNVVGTVGIRLDTEKGLSADALYKDEIDKLRNSGYRVCEFTRLAVDVKVANKPVLASLFHTAYLFAFSLRGYTHAVIEVNPRHVAFYRRSLRFEAIGEERMNQRVQAPAVLLCVSFEEISAGLARAPRQAGATGADRSIFAYCFGSEEEPGILKRLGELDTEQPP